MTAILIFLSVVGWTANGSLLVRRFFWLPIRDSISADRTSVGALLLALPMAWYVGLGLRGVTVSWSYYLGQPATQALWLTGLIGLLGLGATIFRGFPKLKPRLKPSRLSKAELGVLITLIALLVSYAWRTINPWFENDEAIVYGYIARAIANSFVFSDFIEYRFGHHYGPKMIEALDAQLFLFNFDPLLPKLFRLWNIFMGGLLVSGFVYCIAGASRLWALVMFTALFAVPELAHLGVSLKVDSMVMGFELAAIIALAIGLMNYKGTDSKSLVGVALLLALCGFASRQSGLYLAALCTMIFAWLSIRSRRWVPQALGTIIFWGICAVAYIYNYKAFGNPIFPFKAPGPFANGEFLVTLEEYRTNLNLKFLPPVLNELYLLVHLALGLEVRPGIAWIPHALHRSHGMIWLSPALLSVFAAPFFIRKKIIVVLLGVFAYLYAFWCSGVHFSRVFLAASMIPVIIGVVIASLDRKKLNNAQRITQTIVKAGLAGTLVFAALYFAKYSPRYPHTWKAAVSSDARFDSDVRLLLETGEKHIPSKAEIDKINEILRSMGKVRVAATTFTGRWVTILFKHGLITDSHHSKLVTPENFEQTYQHIGCVLIDKDYEPKLIAQKNYVDKTFPENRFTSNNKKWRLQCRN